MDALIGRAFDAAFRSRNGRATHFELEISAQQDVLRPGRDVMQVHAYERGINWCAVFGQILLIVAGPLGFVVALTVNPIGGTLLVMAALAIGIELRRRARHLFRKPGTVTVVGRPLGDAG